MSRSPPAPASAARREASVNSPARAPCNCARTTFMKASRPSVRPASRHTIAPLPAASVR
ncbi:MAG: hypothetical protein LC785_16045 [Acidobacteria bacterium]|nr:hypothetical protein [Acidobacteriota bacterium]